MLNTATKLTCCIVFRNEGDEVENTVKSILDTASNVKIMLVDDCSDDNVDYKAISVQYGTLYHKMEERSGSVGAKDWGVRNAPTDYVVLLDGHMRFYEKEWDVRVAKLLEKYPKSILTSRTIYLNKDENGNVFTTDEGKMHSYGAYVKFGEGLDFDAKWSEEIINYTKADDISDVSCVLGACYCMTKEWWQYINGLKGLYLYGLEEAFISIKTWLMGGGCKILHNFGVGHLYRKVNPHAIPNTDIHANRLAIAYILGNETTDLSVKMYRNTGMFIYGNIMHSFSDRFESLKPLREDFERKKIYDIDWFKKNINIANKQ